MADNQLIATAEESLLAGLMCDPFRGGRRRSVACGTMLHEAGAPATEVFWIQRGQVRLYQLSPDGSRRLLEILGPGDWFGAEAVGQLAHYGCQAKAAAPSTVCVLPVQRLLTALAEHPQTSLEFIRELAGRLSNAQEEAGDLAFDDCRQRLLKMLLKFSRSAAATATSDGVVLRMTHEQLAQAVGAARETVSLMLTQLRNAHLLSTGRNRLAFNPQRLSAILNCH
jgi:CRP-like cAMP-binding protein